MRAIAGILTLWPALSAATVEPEMTAELEPERIYLGTRAVLSVRVVGAAPAEWPAVKAPADVKVSRYGSPTRIRDLIGGTVTTTYRFLLEPARGGAFKIESVSLQAAGRTLTQGPFLLQVVEAPLRLIEARLDPEEITPGESSQLLIVYQGVRPGESLILPDVAGLSFRESRPRRVEVLERGNAPATVFTYEVRAARSGVYQITGISFGGVPAGPLQLTVSPFVVVGAQVAESSLVVGGQTKVHVLVRGLPETAEVKLVAPPQGLTWARSRERFRGPPGVTVFSFDVTATEPGTLAIEAVEVPGPQRVALKPPVVLAVRQAGEGGILACRGRARSEQTVVGEPFIVDFEVFFRGELRAAAVDTSQAAFAKKEYVKIEPVEDLAYPGWSGAPVNGQLDEGQIRMLYGAGEFNGRKEQMLRFAIRFTPLGTGELALDGIRVGLMLQIKEEQRTAFSVFSSTRTQQYVRQVEVSPHRVVDPPGITPPPGYRGAVGSFTFITEVDRTTATAMSPLTLTMRITGEGVGPHFQPPALTEVPELTRDFDVSPSVSGGEVQGQTITFTQVIRPRSEAVKEVPALPLVAYDYRNKRYQTIYSLPIPIEVTPGVVVGASAMQTPQTRPAPAESVASEEGPAPALGANHPDLGEPESGPLLSPLGVGAILLGGPAAVAAALAGQRVYRLERPRAERRRRRRELLVRLDSLGDGPAFYGSLAEVIQSYLRLVLDLPPGEVTPEVLGAVAGGLDANILSVAQDLLRRCDAGRFAPEVIDLDERRRLIDRTRDLFGRLERVAR